LKIWYADSGKLYADLSGYSVQAIAFSPDSTVIAAGTSDEDQNSIRLWDVKTLQVIKSLPSDTGFALDLAFSPDGKWLAGITNDNITQIWDTATGAKIASLCTTWGWNSRAGVAFSPDGKMLVATYDRQAILWDTATWSPTAILGNHLNRIE